MGVWGAVGGLAWYYVKGPKSWNMRGRIREVVVPGQVRACERRG
jgi:hypothetical protein